MEIFGTAVMAVQQGKIYLCKAHYELIKFFNIFRAQIVIHF